ncbi:FAD-dependent oxidoreductase [Corticicoccus populi]|uniref:FAD-dependent oxidoreductase n=1 Tax=Corticicoccus populi TaxID=1812821 RepID=A0ABW5WUI3_9STAP
MGFFRDSMAMFTNYSLPFKYRTQETEDIHTFHFEKPADFSYEAGQYGLFKINHEVLKNKTKPFTISSSPDEDTLSITTRVGSKPSPYKRALMNLNVNHSLSLKGPIGTFNETPATGQIFIAGGMGITPFRAMIKSAAFNKVPSKITLIYFTDDEEPLFKDELESYEKDGFVTLHIKTYDRFSELDQYISDDGSARYLVAGPDQFVTSTFTQLISKGIKKKHIKKDVFYGYK